MANQVTLSVQGEYGTDGSMHLLPALDEIVVARVAGEEGPAQHAAHQQVTDDHIAIVESDGHAALRMAGGMVQFRIQSITGQVAYVIQQDIGLKGRELPVNEGPYDPRGQSGRVYFPVGSGQGHLQVPGMQGGGHGMPIHQFLRTPAVVGMTMRVQDQRQVAELKPLPSKGFDDLFPLTGASGIDQYVGWSFDEISIRNR